LTPKPPPLSTRLLTERLVLRPPRTRDVPELRRVLRKNADHLRPWTPKPRPGVDPSSITTLSKAVLADRRGWRHGTAFVFLVTSAAREPPVIGRVALFDVARGAVQSAHVGYWIDADEQKKGLAREAVRAVLGFAFGPLGLHRVQASIMPRNVASRHIVEAMGMRLEGLAERMIENAGVWEDHLMFAMTAEEWNERAQKNA
jgi:ribosomal-protein-alanine N-acetyltransferase